MEMTTTIDFCMDGSAIDEVSGSKARLEMTTRSSQGTLRLVAKGDIEEGEVEVK
jgi:hypothetical protein